MATCKRNFAIRLFYLLLACLLSACATSPSVDYDQLPYFVYSPVGESGVVDRRLEFAKIFCAVLASGLEPEFADLDCSALLHLDSAPFENDTDYEMDPGEPLNFIFVPGFLGDCLQSHTTPFRDSRPLLEAAGIQTELLMVGGRASSAHNATLIAERLQAGDLQSGPPIVLVGYSKGTADILEAIVNHPESMHRVVGVVSVAGVVNGSPVASDQSGFMEFFIEHLPMSDCASGQDDGSAIESLTYEYRQRWLLEHPLETHIKFFSIAAHASIDEMSNAMETTYKQLRHIDPRNDGQVIYRDAIIPDSELLAFVRADHLAVGLPLGGGLIGTIIDKNEFPRGTLLKSIVIAVQQAME